MFCSRLIKIFFYAVVSLSFSLVCASAQPQSINQGQANTNVELRWGARAGVARYRLQLAADRDFKDIVFDRVIIGNQTQVEDLQPGRYFWRIAPLTTKLGEFSSAGILEVQARASSAIVSPTPLAKPVQAKPPTDIIVAGGGWRAAVGDVGAPVLAHLRRNDRYDVVVTNKDGITYALDSVSGVALWSARAAQQMKTPRTMMNEPPLIVSSGTGLDNVVIINGSSVLKLEGSSGRQLWRSTLPEDAATAFVIGHQNSMRIAILDASLQRLCLLAESDGTIASQIRLPGRVVGKPAFFDNPARTFVIAYENGQIEIRDATGAVIRSGSAASQVTTSPVTVRGRNGDIVLAGTRDGLTALTADSLQPLGRVTLNNDFPQGVLTTHDLDGDGIAEVVMTTARGHVVAVSATDGKILWDASTRSDSGVFAFADINRDGISDVVTTDGFALVALSGHDGSLLWKDTEPSVIANHTASSLSRAAIAVPGGSGALIVVTEPSRGGLRAIDFQHAIVRPTNH